MVASSRGSKYERTRERVGEVCTTVTFRPRERNAGRDRPDGAGVSPPLRGGLPLRPPPNPQRRGRGGLGAAVLRCPPAPAPRRRPPADCVAVRRREAPLRRRSA